MPRLRRRGLLRRAMAGRALLRRAMAGRALLRRTMAEISGGAEALSEIDFSRLCRRHRLPLPDQQERRRHILRFTAFDVRRRPEYVVAQVRAALKAAGWRDGS